MMGGKGNVDVMFVSVNGQVLEILHGNTLSCVTIESIVG